MNKQRLFIVTCSICLLTGCAVETIADSEPKVTRVAKVPARNVVTYRSASEIPGQYTVIEDVWVKDDGDTLPRVLERDLREAAGARGANALILASTNRQLNGLRIDLRVRLDNPFDYYAGTAVWVGAKPAPVSILRP